MGIGIVGNNGVVAEVDGTGFRALRITPRPTEHGALGHYSLSMNTGILPAALAANSEIFQFRWSDASRICLINEVKMSACVSTTFFAAGVPVQIDMVKSTGWTVAGTGGTALTPAALLKKRSAMGATLIPAGDVRVATTAALGAGTKTLEGNSIGGLMGPGPITASLNGQIIPPGTMLFRAETAHGQHPLALVQNEGFSIRSVAVPATGTWMAQIQVDWTEVTVY